MIIIDTMQGDEDGNKGQELILSLTPEEEIVQFNKECEQLTGFQRDEVIHRKFSEVLLPKESLADWIAHMESIRRTLSIYQFVLPIKTKLNQTCIVTWNGIIIKDANGSIKDICLFGKPQKPIDTITGSSLIVQMTSPHPAQENTPNLSELPVQEASHRGVFRKHDKRKILFAEEKEDLEKPVSSSLKQAYQQHSQHTDTNIGLEKFDLVHTSLEELNKKYDSVLKRIDDLEMKDKRLRIDNKNLDKNTQLKDAGVPEFALKKNQHHPKNDSSHQPHIKNNDSFFSDLFGFRRKQKALSEQKQQLEMQAVELTEREERLTNEQKTFKTRVEEFCRWRDKLELLETEIERRRQELMEQEEATIPQSSAPLIGTVHSHPDIVDATPSILPESQEHLDNISESAIIIQRGILKRINSSFATMLGYSIDEIIEKSFFDLIATDGLADIERYYLDRLKGENVSVYKTVFSTKDNNKIAVEVNIKQAIYNGEKAEIAIVKKLN